MTEWTLSDRMMSKFSNANKMDYYFFYDKDVKEFIRRLKGKLMQTKGVINADIKVITKLIDKLAGEKLV